MEKAEMKTGICYLVGAGPGDPGLITLKAKECLERADVLVYDALSNPLFLQWVPAECEKIYAGKRAKHHSIPQGGINQLLVENAKAGKVVVRLKGGDPMIFGRGGEEAAELAAAGVVYEIVPGISSAIAGPCYAGIPVTHRDHNTSLTIFTGHEDPTKGYTSIDYESLAKAPGTKVFLMGVERLRVICGSLIEAGAEPSTPIALTRWATTGRQRTIVGTLEDISDIAERTNFKSPAVAVIGDVVAEREKINWFETRPLIGQRVVVTRTRQQAGELSRQLSEHGADVVELPTIKITYPEDMKDFAQGVADCHRYDWVVFTSPNAVHRFFEAFFELYEDVRSFGGARIAVIGPGTADAVKQYHLGVDLLPKKFVAEGLVEAFGKHSKEVGSIENLMILRVKAAEVRDVVTEGLTELGAIVDECIAYQTVAETEDPTGARAQLADEGADWITFTSASTVENFFALGIDWPTGCRAASIGPITSEALRKHGIEPFVEADPSTISGLVDALLKGVSAGSRK